MTLRNTTRSWGALSKSLHWLIVLLIILQWVFMMRAEALPLGDGKAQMFELHKSFGMTVLLLAIIRLVWRWMNPVPSLDGQAKGWERGLARLSHFLLYALIFVIPLSGWLMSSARGFSVSWFKQFTWPDLVARDGDLYELMKDLHHLLFAALVVVALLHIAGALKHHFIDRNNVLKRMLPFGGRE